MYLTSVNEIMEEGEMLPLRGMVNSYTQQANHEEKNKWVSKQQK
jgi:hypothetical protein